MLITAPALFCRALNPNPTRTGFEAGLEIQRRRGHNKAAVAVANKMARIVWAVWKFGKPFQSRSQNDDIEV